MTTTYKAEDKAVADVLRAYPSMTTDEVIASLIMADERKAKAKAKRDKAKAELVAKGATVPVGAETPKVETAKPETAKPAAIAPTMTHTEFVLRAIRKLRKPPYKGIHSVYSGTNKAFGDYFHLSNAETIEAIGVVVSAGAVVSRPVKGGVMLYVAGDMPASSTTGVLDKILGD